MISAERSVSVRHRIGDIALVRPLLELERRGRTVVAKNHAGGELFFDVELIPHIIEALSDLASNYPGGSQ